MLVHFSVSVIKRNIMFLVKGSTSQCGTGPPVSKYESYLHTFIRNFARLLSTLDNTHTHTDRVEAYMHPLFGDSKPGFQCTFHTAQTLSETWV